MRSHLLRSFVLLGLVLVSTVQTHAADEAPANKWEASIARFEAKDKETPPPANPIVFVGSSSIVKWKTAEAFPNLPVLNRGFGGSQIADSVLFADRIVTPYKPKVVVFYAGDNDIGAKKSPQQVAADFDAFTAKVFAKVPETKIVVIAIKPSVKRWALIENIRKLNELLQASVKKDPRMVYVDIHTPMLGADGQPRVELLAADGLHLSPAGYELWNSLVGPQIGASK